MVVPDACEPRAYWYKQCCLVANRSDDEWHIVEVPAFNSLSGPFDNTCDTTIGHTPGQFIIEIQLQAFALPVI